MTSPLGVLVVLLHGALGARKREVPAAGEALPTEWDPAVLLPALRAADLLARERLQVSDQVRQKVVDDDPRDDVVRVDRPDPERELELLVDLLRHRALAVRGRERALRDIGRLVREREPFV